MYSVGLGGFNWIPRQELVGLYKLRKNVVGLSKEELIMPEVETEANSIQATDKMKTIYSSNTYKTNRKEGTKFTIRSHRWDLSRILQ